MFKSTLSAEAEDLIHTLFLSDIVFSAPNPSLISVTASASHCNLSQCMGVEGPRREFLQSGFFLLPNWIACFDGQVTHGLVFCRHFLFPTPSFNLVATIGVTSPASPWALVFLIVVFQ